MKPEQAGKVSIVLVGAALLLITEQERGLLQTLSVSPAVQSSFEVGQVFRDRMKNGTGGPEMVVIPAGRFRMGDIQGNGAKDEQPVHEVHIPSRIAVSRYEVTFDQYDDFAKATGRDLPDDEGSGRGRRPVVRISWDDAVAYAKWLSQQTGKNYRLPSEAEWEYAARAGTQTTYWWGNEIKQGLANCIGCGSRWDNQRSAPVGSFKSNPFSLYDTAGNVSEWVQD
ncbi:MAG: formylglycine-generating enzyme family protein, partial [Candidatus Binatia bacterium]